MLWVLESDSAIKLCLINVHFFTDVVSWHSGTRHNRHCHPTLSFRNNGGGMRRAGDDLDAGDWSQCCQEQRHWYWKEQHGKVGAPSLGLCRVMIALYQLSTSTIALILEWREKILCKTLAAAQSTILIHLGSENVALLCWAIKWLNHFHYNFYTFTTLVSPLVTILSTKFFHQNIADVLRFL